jgi:ATP-dependent Zn protease
LTHVSPQDHQDNAVAPSGPPAGGGGSPTGLIENSPIVEMHRILSKDLRRLLRIATIIAVLTSPAVFIWYYKHEHWSLLWSIIGTFFTIVLFRGLIDIVVRRLIPWPSLFGTVDARAVEEDIVNRRRAWTWRWFARVVRNLLIIMTIIWAIRPGGDRTLQGWLNTPSWMWNKFQHLFSSSTFWVQLAFGVGLFFVNFIIFMGPLLAMGISQIRGFEPGDAEWGVDLDHVRGQAEAKEDVRRVVTLWQSGELFEGAGGKRERGLLFLGPPGTGKTMLAKAIATGFNSPFVTIPGSGFAQTFIGVDAIIVRFLARKSKKLARKWGGQCIVFIDEIDAVGMRRQSLGPANENVGIPPTPFFGPWGVQGAPDGDIYTETREWRDWVFNNRAPDRRSPYPSWYSGLAGRVNGVIDRQGMFPGFGGMGSMALNQLLVTMDGIDNPPFIRRVMTNKTNSFLDAVYLVPRRVGRKAGIAIGVLVSAAAATLFVNDLLYVFGVKQFTYLTGHTTLWNFALLAAYVMILYAGIGIARKANKEGTLSLRIPRAKPGTSQIYFIGATNVPLERLDPALVRPGRMGRHIRFRSPTKDDRKDIFDLYLGKVAHDPELDTEARRDEIARITSGYSPADIDQICSMALSTAHHEGRMYFNWDDLIDAMTVVDAGQAVNIERTEFDLRATALHEAGHAAMSHLYEPKLESSRLSIRWRGNALGHHSQREKEEAEKNWQSDLRGRLIAILGAMATEHVFYGENAGGVYSDLQMSTSTAVLMVDYIGMAPNIPQPNGHRFDGEDEDDTVRRIKLRYQDIGNRLLSSGGGATALNGMKRQYAAEFMGEAFATAYNTVKLNKDAVETIANVLLEKREIMGDELLKLLDDQNLQIPTDIDWTAEDSWPQVVVWSKYRSDSDKGDKDELPAGGPKELPAG